MELTPVLVLSMWSAGIAFASAVVVYWRIVGPGFVRMSALVLVLVAGGAAGTGGGFSAWTAVAAAVAAVLLARRTRFVTGLMIVASVLLVFSATADSPLLPVVTGAALLGAVTVEMLLGHWYLVDPQLPRWALQFLALAAGIGLLVDLSYFAIEGAFGWSSGDAVVGWSLVALALLSLLLIVGVSFSLREPSYTGVMAATGLTYLAVLTTFGVAVLGRTLLT